MRTTLALLPAGGRQPHGEIRPHDAEYHRTRCRYHGPLSEANGVPSAQLAFRHPTRYRALLDGTWRGYVTRRPGHGDRGRAHMADEAGDSGRQCGCEGLPSYGVPGRGSPLPRESAQKASDTPRADGFALHLCRGRCVRSMFLPSRGPSAAVSPARPRGGCCSLPLLASVVRVPLGTPVSSPASLVPSSLRPPPLPGPSAGRLTAVVSPQRRC